MELEIVPLVDLLGATERQIFVKIVTMGITVQPVNIHVAPHVQNMEIVLTV